MRNNIELLAPGGDINSIKSAIAAGANAIYCGINRFNARTRATNISVKDLNGIIHLAHTYNCKIFITLNILILENEIPAFVKLLNLLKDTRIDGIILQDVGMLHLVSSYFPSLDIHASTQLTTHNRGQLSLLKKFNTKRVNLARELSLQEVKELTSYAHNIAMETEIFVHGSYCISFSGLCYMSSFSYGKSGNRGCCSQPCRSEYIPLNGKSKYPLNVKDISLFNHINNILASGVDSIKIEGRIKKFHYVYTVVQSWRDHLDTVYKPGNNLQIDDKLHMVFNRGFSDAFFSGNLDDRMFIDNPRDNSAKYIYKITPHSSQQELEIAKKKIYDKRTEIIETAIQNIKNLTVEQVPIKLTITGSIDTPLEVLVKLPHRNYKLYSQTNLTLSHIDDSQNLQIKKTAKKKSIDHHLLGSLFKPINNTEYNIVEIDTSHLDKGLHLPLSQLNELKNRTIQTLTGLTNFQSPVKVPDPVKNITFSCPPTFGVLISDISEVSIFDHLKVKIYFQVPSHLRGQEEKLSLFFYDHPEVTPWFPSILIGRDFELASNLVKDLKPSEIISDNLGIGYSCLEEKLPWIAGPLLNTTNSHTLKALQEMLYCGGAFLSPELSKRQIKRIQCPPSFKLLYNMYYPIPLMTSRQCLFFQTKGCKNGTIDKYCLPDCENHTILSHPTKSHFIVEKSFGEYCKIYSSKNFFNPSIVLDCKGKFSCYFLDLRNIQTRTILKVSKADFVNRIIKYTTSPDRDTSFKDCIQNTSNTQYINGM